MHPTLCSHGFTHRGLTWSYLRNAGGFLGDVSKRMQVYRYMNRGLYERDKMLFKLLVTLKIMTVASQILGKRSRRIPTIHTYLTSHKMQRRGFLLLITVFFLVATMNDILAAKFETLLKRINEYTMNTV